MAGGSNDKERSGPVAAQYQGVRLRYVGSTLAFAATMAVAAQLLTHSLTFGIG